MDQAKPRFCFADTETDGLADSVEEAIREGRQVIEYAFVIWEDGDRTAKLEKKVMPTGDAIERCEGLAAKGYNHFNGTRNWMNPHASGGYSHAVPWSSSDCENVDNFLGGETLAGSNPMFDLIMFQAQFYALGFGDKFPQLATHRKLDIAQGAWFLWTVGLVERTGLETLARFLNVEHAAHTAMGDVEAAIDCFEILLDSYVFRPRQLTELLYELGKDKGIAESIITREVGKLRGVAL